VGVNNRDLHTFNVSLECSERIIATIPEGVIAVAESGITSPEQVTELRKAGYRGFLIGEAFMRDAEPALSCKRFIERVEGYRHG
jgi:indole-3-glycerol phosphate synthase